MYLYIKTDILLWSEQLDIDNSFLYQWIFNIGSKGLEEFPQQIWAKEGNEKKKGRSQHLALNF